MKPSTNHDLTIINPQWYSIISDLSTLLDNHESLTTIKYDENIIVNDVLTVRQPAFLKRT